MLIEVKVPHFAESITEGTLLEWKKQPGETVQRDEILIEIETDKVVLEVPAPESGVLKEVVKEDGATVLSDELIARLDTDGGVASIGQAAPAAAEKRSQAAPQKKPPTDETKPPAVVEKEEQAAEEMGLSPAVRKLIGEHGLDPAELAGTGKGGRITKEDVLAHLATRQPAAEVTQPPVEARPKPAPVAPAVSPAVSTRGPTADRQERRVPITRIRARIAERLVQAQRTAAILTTFNEINMQPVLDLRRRYKQQFEQAHGVRLGIMSFFTKAVVEALKKFPAVNASIDGSDIVYHDYYDIGIAVGSPRGLVVPIVRDADNLTFAQIEQKIAEFGDKAQTGQLSVEELSGGTFTITNGGVFGSLLSTPILNPPQSGILGMHKTQERPMVDNGEIVIRPMMYVALSYDHRIIDGRDAVTFLVTVKEALEDPSRMLLGV